MVDGGGGGRRVMSPTSEEDSGFSGTSFDSFAAAR